MKGLIVLAVLAVAAPLLATGCGSPGPAYYLASNSSAVELVQWAAPANGQAQGDVTYDSVSTGGSNASSPDSLSVQSDPVMVTISGSQATLSGFLGASVSGQINSSGDLVLDSPPDSSTGQITDAVLVPSSASAYNAAVRAVDKTVAADNAQAAAQVAAQQQAQQNEQAQQAAVGDVSQLNSDADNLPGDVTNLNGDVHQAVSDLQQTQSDASQGQGYDCENVQDTVYNDAATTLYNDQVTSLANDVTTLQQDISTVQGDIITLKGALSTLRADGLAEPSGSAIAISGAQTAISSAVSQANTDIGQVNSDVVQGYSLANGLATGQCAGDGPGSPPSPQQDISA